MRRITEPILAGQLAAYLERLSLGEGTLLIFDLRKGRPGLPEAEEEVQGKRLRVVVL